MSFRRDLATLLAAHDLDPGRCDLLVEGEEDRRVLLWLVGDRRSPGAVVTSVEHIDVEVAEGGNRERLVEVARLLNGKDACVMCLIDAGLDELSDEEMQLAKLTFTDGPDLEGYVLQGDCIEKFLRLGLKSDSWAPDDLLAIALKRARKVGALRIMSTRKRLDLPFQGTELRRHVRVERSSDIEVDERSFLEALCQNAGISLTKVDELLTARDAIEAELSDKADRACVHGKDVFCLLGEIAQSEGAQRSEARGLLWSSLERRMVEGQERLGRIMGFLENCCGARAVAP